MLNALAIRLDETTATAVVASHRQGRILVEAVLQLPVAEGSEGVRAAGQALSAELNSLRYGKLPAVAAVPRSLCGWQTFDLPPAPLDELPDLVHMQAERDMALTPDGLGFDYLPLSDAGADAWKVIGIHLPAAELVRQQQFFEAAQIKLERVVPEPLGWLPLAEIDGNSDRAPAVQEPRQLQVFLACGEPATIWASEGGELRLLRTIITPRSAENADSESNALASELRRTLLAISRDGDDANISLCVIGFHGPTLAAQLTAALGRPVEGRAVGDAVETVDSGLEAVWKPEFAPMAGLAAELSARKLPPVDLIHPRRRPVPPKQTRMHVLAAVAAALLAALIVYKCYRNLQEPLEAAATAAAELKLLEPELESRASDESRAAAIQRWLDESGNLLIELSDASRALRPQPTSAPDFSRDQDLVVTKLVTANGISTLSAAARNSDSVRPAEERLRQAGYHVNRGPLDFGAKSVPEYGVGVSLTFDHSGEGASDAEGAR